MAAAKTTVIVTQYQEAATQAASSNTYASLRMHALPGLHETIGALCSRHFAEGARILDLAAGSGAMSMRLKHLGFEPTATDYVPENFRATGIPFQQIDLNTSFSGAFEQGSFDGIVASEIIEHLENPWHFFRQCQTLLKPGGRVILSTPNTQSSASIAAFLRSGNFLWFTDADRDLEGHISPLTLSQIRYAIDCAGMCLDWEGSFGDRHSKIKGSPRMSSLARVIDLLSRVPASIRGEIYLCVARKPVVCS